MRKPLGVAVLGRGILAGLLILIAGPPGGPGWASSAAGLPRPAPLEVTAIAAGVHPRDPGPPTVPRLDPALRASLAEAPGTFFLRLELPFASAGTGQDRAGQDRAGPEQSDLDRVPPLPHAALPPGISAALEGLLDRGALTTVEAFPAFGLLAVRGSAEAAEQLAGLAGVAAVLPNRRHRVALGAPADLRGADILLEPAPIAWNLALVGAERAWSTLGASGEGQVVAVLDSGVDWRHPALGPSYRGRPGDHDYHWLDLAGGAAPAGEPTDRHGHGTHVTGIVAGRAGTRAYGVAPGARWIAAAVFDGAGETTDLTLVRGAAWALAPTRMDGSAPRPDLAPDVVNCSWSLDNGADPLFEPVIRAWRAAGIVPVFAAGNIESGQWTRILAPASDPGALAVGAVTADDQVWWRSRGGPGFHPVQKPDLVAPGVAVPSTWPGGGLASMDGTSMAAPHVAGAAALLRSANPALGVDDVAAFLRAGARDLEPAGPDPAAGWGRLDLHASTAAALRAGRLAGRVTDAGGRPIGSAQIRAEDPATTRKTPSDENASPGAWAWSTRTDPGGGYAMALPEGDWDLVVSAFGHAPRVLPARIRPGETLLRDAALAPLPTGRVEGSVRSAAGGVPEGAVVEVAGEAGTAMAVDAQGAYALALPGGSHGLRFAAPEHQALTATVQVTVGATTALDRVLPGAPRILLVDADAWDEERIAPYLLRPIEAAGFAAEVWTLSDPRAAPDLDALAAYDLVIWSHIYNSPGRLDGLRGDRGVTGALADFVRGGGRLLMTGMDVGAWDARQPRRSGLAPEFFERVLGAAFLADAAAAPPRALGLGPLAGLGLELDRPEGAEKSRRGVLTDVVEPAPGAGSGAVMPILAYPEGGFAGLAASDAEGRRAYLAFAPENAGPPTALTALFDRLIAWLEPPALGVTVEPALVGWGEDLTIELRARAGRAALPVDLEVALPPGFAPLPGGDAPAGTRGWRWTETLPAASPRLWRLPARLVGPSPGAGPHPITATLAAAGRVVSATAQLRARLPDLAASTLEVSPARLPASGGAVTASLRLANLGPAAAPSATLRLRLPAGLDAISPSLRVSSGRARWVSDHELAWAGSIGAGEAPWLQLGLVAESGLDRRLDLRAQLDEGFGRGLERRGSLRVGGPRLEGSPMLEFPITVLAGEDFTPTLRLANHGPVPAAARLALNLPPGLRLSPWAAGFAESGPLGAGPGSAAAAGSRRATWMGTLAPDSALRLPIPLRALPEAAAGAREIDWTLDDGLEPAAPISGSFPIDLRRAELGASRLVLWPGRLRAGERVTATILVANYGDAPAEVQVSGALSPGLVPLPGEAEASTGQIGFAPGTLDWRLRAQPARDDYLPISGPPTDAPEPGPGSRRTALGDPSRADAGEPIELGLPFPFYTQVYTRAWLSAGLLAFEDPGRPEALPRVPLLAPLWRETLAAEGGWPASVGSRVAGEGRPAGWPLHLRTDFGLVPAEPGGAPARLATEQRAAYLLRGRDAVTITWSAASPGSGRTAVDRGAYALILRQSGGLEYRYGPEVDAAGAWIGLLALDGHPVDGSALAAPGRSLVWEPPGGWAWLRLPSRVSPATEPNRLLRHRLTLRGAGEARELAAGVLVNPVELEAGPIQAWPPTPLPGATLAYSLGLRAEGTVPARDLELSLDLPDSGELVTEGLPPDLLYDPATDSLRWKGDLAPGAERWLHWRLRLHPGLLPGARVVTQGSLRGRALGPESRALDHALRVASADLSGSTKRVEPAVARPGDRVRFILRAANAGPQATEVELSDALPPGLDYVAGSAEASAGAAPAWDAASRSLRWRGSLPAAGAVELRFEARLNSSLPLVNAMRLEAASGIHWAAWAELGIERSRLFLPLTGRDR